MPAQNKQVFGREAGEGFNKSLYYGAQTDVQAYINLQGRAITAFPLKDPRW